jgi:hypothetical protein
MYFIGHFLLNFLYLGINTEFNIQDTSLSPVLIRNIGCWTLTIAAKHEVIIFRRNIVRNISVLFDENVIF